MARLSDKNAVLEAIPAATRNHGHGGRV